MVLGEFCKPVPFKPVGRRNHDDQKGQNKQEIIKEKKPPPEQPEAEMVGHQHDRRQIDLCRACAHEKGHQKTGDDRAQNNFIAGKIPANDFMDQDLKAFRELVFQVLCLAGLVVFDGVPNRQERNGNRYNHRECADAQGISSKNVRTLIES